MSPNSIFDHDLLVLRHKRIKKNSNDSADFLLKYAQDEISDRLMLIERQFNAPAVLHNFDQTFPGSLPNSKIGGEILIQDFAPSSHDNPDSNTDLDILPLKFRDKDLIISPLSLQLANDTPGLFKQIFNALKSDGLFLAATLGAGTLSELRECLLIAESQIHGGASARVAPFADIRDYGGLLQRAGFALPVIDSQTITVRYADMFGLMRDLRQMGMANPLIDRSRKPVSRTFFKTANDIYLEKFSDDDGRIRASFTFIFLSGWKPHENQQKPLKPGSAKSRLSDALNVDEIKLPK